MVVGAYGDTVFEVSDFKILTVTNFKRDTKANFAEHKIIGRPAILEFEGRDLEQISFTAIFRKDLGIDDVLMEVHKLREMAWNGEADFFILGDHAYTENMMVVESLSETVTEWTRRGGHLIAKVDVTLKEYVEI